MARTTLMLDDALLRRLKERAARQGQTLQSLVNALLRQALHQKSPTRFSFKLKGWEAREQPGVDILDRDALFRVMEER